MLIDGTRLEAWLNEQQASLIASARERHEADGADDPTALRMDGGVAFIGVMLGQLRNFEVTGRRNVSHETSQVPIEDLTVPTNFKVRRHDRGTSWEAAYMQSPERSRRLFRAIYLALSHVGPQTDDELTHRLANFIQANGYSPNSVRKRRGELVQAGWVRATQERRWSDFHAAMTVWEAVPEEP